MYGTKSLEAVFLDFDGVIVDSVKIKGEAFAQLYRPFGKKIAADVLKHHLANGGMTRRDKFCYYHRVFLKLQLPICDLNDMTARFAELVKEAVIECPLILGAMECLTTLSNQVPLFVVSATPSDELKFILLRRGLMRFFKSAHGAPESKTEILQRLIEKHLLAPDRCIMVGDSFEDHVAADAANISFVGVEDPSKKTFPENFDTVANLIELKTHLFKTDKLLKL